jgi:TonB family protein
MNLCNVLRGIPILVPLFLTACFGGAGDHSYDRAKAELYAHQLHDRFYEHWTPPGVVQGERGKVPVPVDVRIDADGRVIDFKIAQSSNRPAIDKSIAAVASAVRRVDSPPFRLANRFYELRIYFELDVK